MLTSIQRDLAAEAPGQMTLIVNCLREAFLQAEAPPQVSSAGRMLRFSMSNKEV